MTAALQVFAGAVLPLDWLTLNTCVYGVSGAGKSTFARRVAEEVYRAGERFSVIDPKGDWHGLAASSDGKSEGLPVVIFGGDRGHFPLEKDVGAALGEAIANRRQSTVLDLSRMRPFDRPYLLARFFESLFHHNRDPLLLINDEAQDYCPQAGRSGRGDDDDVRRCLGAAIVIAKQGRTRGLGRMYVTQRAPGLHTEVREIAEVVAAFRSTGKNDKERIAAWLASMLDGEELKEAVRSLPGLGDGECLFACSNKLLRQCAARRVLAPTTFDSSRTPRIGERRREPARFSAPDRAAFEAALKETLERERNEDPELLRRRLAELEQERDALRAELATTKVAEPTTKVVERLVEALSEAMMTRLERAAEALHKTGIAAVEAARDVMAALPAGVEVRTFDPKYAHPETAHAPKGAGRKRNPTETSAQSAPGFGALAYGNALTNPRAATTPPEGWTMEEEDLYQKFKARLIQEAPALVVVLATSSELEVTVQRKTVQIDGSTAKGRIARLIADGFFDEPTTNGAVRKELARTGPDANTGTISKAIAEFTAMGLLTSESGGFQKAPGAKVTTKTIEAG